MPLASTPVAWMVGTIIMHLAVFWVGRNEGLRGADEAYLVYGSARTRLGEIPIRDFRAYEPGRYWFVVAMSAGKVTIRRSRLACGVFHGLASGALVAALQHLGVTTVGLVAVVAITVGWTYLPHQRIDAGVPFVVVAAGAMALHAPVESGWWLVAGIVVGGAGVIGVNWGLYASVATALVGGSRLAASDAIASEIGSIGWRLVVGALIGASPLLATAVVARGFGAALLERRLFALVRRGSTNLPLPYPWPWREPRPTFTTWYGQGTRPAMLVMFLVPIVCGVVIVAAFADPLPIGRDPRPAAVAAAAMTIAVWHYFGSRADIAHLMIWAPLGLISGVLVLEPAPLVARLAFAVPAMAVGVWTLRARADWWVRRRRPEEFRRLTDPALPATTRRLSFHHNVADVVERVAPLVAAHAPDEPWLAVPNQMYLLPLVDRTSAVFDLFCVYPAAAGEEDRMLAELEAARPPVAVVGMAALNGDPALRFALTHPRVFAHIQSTMHRRSDLDRGLAGGVQIYTAAAPPAGAEPQREAFGG